MTTPNHRKQRANNSREHILDTYVDLLIRFSGRTRRNPRRRRTPPPRFQGRATTTSHSKKALLEGRSQNAPSPLAKEDFCGDGKGTRGASAYYINSSTPDNNPVRPCPHCPCWPPAQSNNEPPPSRPRVAYRRAGMRSFSREIGDEQMPAPCCSLGDGMCCNAGVRGDSASLRGLQPSGQTERHSNAPRGGTQGGDSVKPQKPTRHSA